jgi:hypothetical protein
MRKKIIQHLGDGGEGLDPLVKEGRGTCEGHAAHEADYSG